MKKFFFISLVLTCLSACSDDKPQALGTLERDRITFTATANEIIRQLPVKEGSTVTQGQVLVELDKKNQQAVLANARAESAKAQAYLLKLSNGERIEDIAAAKAHVDSAMAQLLDAKKSYLRIAELVEKRLASPADLDSALARRDSAQGDLGSAKDELAKLTAGSRSEDIEQAKASLMAAKANALLQQQKLGELTIVATRNGVLDNLPYHLGERVPVNSTVAIMQADSVPYARVYVPVDHRVNFVPGKRVKVHVDGVDAPFSGKVRWVATEPSFTPYYALTEQERSRLMYLAEIDLTDDARQLPSGVPAQVDLVD
ncbi:HlyD family efflux transporter periplasmic adaptor subunit [uncultured Vibrio sp.]|uniref:HlyD family secretion protein n=1 Tax=uncultured Vibrio sp. TaxID=114054 RepID=UPI002638A5C8|nr:HlyD family efflux transporter periplasmic adaptor subunit [uncultured Vibrio sp.]